MANAKVRPLIANVDFATATDDDIIQMLQQIDKHPKGKFETFTYEKDYEIWSGAGDSWDYDNMETLYCDDCAILIVTHQDLVIVQEYSSGVEFEFQL